MKEIWTRIPPPYAFPTLKRDLNKKTNKTAACQHLSTGNKRAHNRDDLWYTHIYLGIYHCRSSGSIQRNYRIQN
jgi:hypothetical protein